MDKLNTFKETIPNIEERIGYIFKNKNLLIQSFTHSSYAYENQTPSYERLEFLGDGILDMIIAKGLFNENPQIPEGTMSPLRSLMVAAKPLSDIFDKLGLGEYIITSEGAIKEEVKTGINVKSDIIESIIASIYLDGGIDAAESFIMQKIYDKDIKDEPNAKDYKSLIYEFAVKNSDKVEFKSKQENEGFTVTLFYNGKEICSHFANKKKEGEKLCAKDYLDKNENIL